MTTATYIKRLDGWTGDARLYRLSQPARYGWSDEDPGERDHTQYIIVSAVSGFGGPETYIFPADLEGNVVNWGEMKGSFQGACDHALAIANAGLLLVTNEEARP